MRYVIVLLIGSIIGGALVYFLLAGAPRVEKLPGMPLKSPEAGGDPPGTAVLTLDEQFFNTLLGSVFRDLGAPTFRLAKKTGEAQFVEAQAGGGGCQNQVVVAEEGSGVRTGVRLASGQIVAPLAFSGSRDLLGSCLNFRGWAQANIQLSFKPEEQTLYGQINVEGVNLDGVNPLVSGIVTQFVQNSINQRVNPLILMRGAQLALAVPVQSSNGTLRAQAKDIRSEVKDGALKLHITYDFNAAPSGAAPPQQPQS